MKTNLNKISSENGLLTSRLSSDKIINSLPGIFYLYKKVGNDFLLKRWNRNHVTELEYSDRELLNMRPSQFLLKKEAFNLKYGIQEVFEKGSAQINLTLISKTGKRIPYYIEGHAINLNGENYFMGVGIDVSAQYKLQSSLSKSEKMKQKALEELQKKERELLATSLQLSENNEKVNLVNNKLKAILKKKKAFIAPEELLELTKSLEFNFSRQNNWKLFKTSFTQLHKDFFFNLFKAHPALTNTELKFCAYLKINMLSHQISSALNISKEGIKKSRYRIRKKIGLPHGDSLENYINNF